MCNSCTHAELDVTQQEKLTVIKFMILSHKLYVFSIKKKLTELPILYPCQQKGCQDRGLTLHSPLTSCFPVLTPNSQAFTFHFQAFPISMLKFFATYQNILCFLKSNRMDVS